MMGLSSSISAGPVQGAKEQEINDLACNPRTPETPKQARQEQSWGGRRRGGRHTQQLPPPRAGIPDPTAMSTPPLGGSQLKPETSRQDPCPSHSSQISQQRDRGRTRLAWPILPPPPEKLSAKPNRHSGRWDIEPAAGMGSRALLQLGRVPGFGPASASLSGRVSLERSGLVFPEGFPSRISSFHSKPPG